MIIYSLLLQATEPVLLTPDALETITLWELLLKGGYMMIALTLLWVFAIYIFVERMLVIKASGKTPDSFQDEIKHKVLAGRIDEARLLCSQWDTPVARMIEKGVSKIGTSLKNIEVSIENTGKIEIYRLEKNLSMLATISGAAPMMGFLGTVMGMIQAFISIAQEEGAVSPKLLSSGIYEAMITTAFGLFIGILAYLGYNYLVTRVQKLVHRMEYTAIDFVDLLQEPQK
ncbi:MAG: MotA/TolQ/ExbB proton channel family protein [Cyclobacteriaceae bacterium]